MRAHLLATSGVAALLAAMPAHAQTMTDGAAKRRLGATGRGRARIARRACVLVAASLVLATAAHAQTWVLNPTDTVTIPGVGTFFNYTSLPNFGGVFPGNNGTATFGATNGSNISFSALTTTVGGWTFTPG